MSKAHDLLVAYDNLTWETYVDLSTSLSNIDPRYVDEALATQPQLYSYYAGLYETAKQDVANKENDLNNAEADAKAKAVKHYQSTGSRPTAVLLDAFVDGDEVVKDLRKELIDTEYKAGLLKALMYALSQRKDCLVQLSANNRAEKGLYN